MIEFFGSDFEKNPPKGWVFEFFWEKSSVMLSFEGQNPLSFLGTWVFFRLSFFENVKKKPGLSLLQGMLSKRLSKLSKVFKNLHKKWPEDTVNNV